MKSKSALLGILVVFAGYTVASFGWVLVKGWNITFVQWVSPINPYVWTGSDPGTIPDGQIFAGQPNTPNSAGSGLAATGLGAAVGAGAAAGGLTAGAVGSGGSGGVGSGGSPNPISGLGSITLPGVTANPNVGALFPVVQPYSPPTVRVGQSSQRESL